MNKLLAKKFFIAYILILVAILAFTGFNSLKEKSSSGPSINFVQSTTNKKQPYVRYTQTRSKSNSYLGLYFHNHTIGQQMAVYDNYEAEPLASVLKSRTAYQPISEESYALALSAFGNNSFVGTSVSTTGGKHQGKAFNVSSRVPTSLGVIAFVNSTAVSTPSVQNSDQADKSSSQLAEPFSDGGGRPYFNLPEDPGEPFPDEPVPVGSGVTFLCCCALAYIRVKFKNQKF